MKYIVTTVFCSLLINNFAFASMGAADTDPPPMTATTEDSNLKMDQLNSQIQSQLKAIQTEQQQQINTLNSQLQAQLKKLQTDMQAQLQTSNKQIQGQMKQLQDNFHEQLNQLQQQIKH